MFVYARQSERLCVCVCVYAQADGGWCLYETMGRDGSRRTGLPSAAHFTWRGGVAGVTSSVSGGVENEYSAVSTNVSALTRTPPL